VIILIDVDMKAASQLLVDISLQRGLTAYNCHSPARKRCLKNTIRTAKAISNMRHILEKSAET
jgi:hypothetical protein